MNRTCQSCAQINPPHANFCASCGKRLAVAVRSPCGCSLSPVLAGFVCGAFLFVMVLPPLSLHSSVRRWWRDARPSTAAAELQAYLKLPPDKADALFTLLAPADIAVRVGRWDGGIMIFGTPDEVDTLERFAGLLTRLNDFSPAKAKAYLRAYRGNSLNRAYRLPEEQTRMLMRVLARNGIPAEVHACETGISVSARPADHETIEQVTRILRGRRLIGTHRSRG